MPENIGRLVQNVPTYTTADTGKVIHRFFEENPYAEGIVILEGETPIGLMMRNDFYQKIGKQYGYTLFMNRSISLLMNSSLLIVDASMEVVDVSIMAMDREQENLYDFVIVTEDGRYLGVVSIKLFLFELSKKREKEIALLKEQQEILRRANETEKLHLKEMQEKNNSIRNLLDNAGQGFLSFGADLIISEEYSLECTRIFQNELGGQSFGHLLSKYTDEKTEETVQNVFENFFKEESSFKSRVYLTLLPKELSIKGKTVRFEYKILEDPTSKRLMVVLTDITDKKALEAKMAEERKNLKLIVKVIGSRSELIRAMDDFEYFFEKQIPEILDFSMTPKEIISEIFRHIHTFKGDFSHLCMYHAAEQLHDLEDSIAHMMEMLEQSEELSLTEAVQFLRRIDYAAVLERDLSIISDALGEGYLKSKESYSISEDRILAMEEKISTLEPTEQTRELHEMVRQLRYSNLKDALLQYNDSVKNLAGRFDKAVADLAVTGDDIFIERKKFANMVKSLVHIFRNAIDHGIEPPEERLNQGKQEHGSIECRLQLLQNGNFTCLIRDDGKGIERAAVMRKAVERGILKQAESRELPDEKVLQLIFEDHFSTKDAVSTLSGRGMGLSAVKREAEKLDGKIEVRSETGKYTEFALTLPVA